MKKFSFLRLMGMRSGRFGRVLGQKSHFQPHPFIFMISLGGIPMVSGQTWPESRRTDDWIITRLFGRGKNACLFAAASTRRPSRRRLAQAPKVASGGRTYWHCFINSPNGGHEAARAVDLELIIFSRILGFEETRNWRDQQVWRSPFPFFFVVAHRACPMHHGCDLLSKNATKFVNGTSPRLGSVKHVGDVEISRAVLWGGSVDLLGTWYAQIAVA